MAVGARGACKHSPFELVNLLDGFGQGVSEKLVLVAERGDNRARHWGGSSGKVAVWRGRDDEE